MFPNAQANDNYVPRTVQLFRPARIVLAKGSHRTEARRRFAARICGAYPEAEVVEAFDTPHNRVDLGTANPLQLHSRGKRTLVGRASQRGAIQRGGRQRLPKLLALFTLRLLPLWLPLLLSRRHARRLVFTDREDILQSGGDSGGSGPHGKSDRPSDRILSGQASGRLGPGTAHGLRADNGSVLRSPPSCTNGRSDEQRDPQRVANKIDNRWPYSMALLSCSPAGAESKGGAR